MKAIKVSVPSRGLSYLKNEENKCRNRKDGVSVPSRGLSYLKDPHPTPANIISSFPSPHGDSLI